MRINSNMRIIDIDVFTYVCNEEKRKMKTSTKKNVNVIYFTLIKREA